MLSLQEIICHSLLLKISSQVINENIITGYRCTYSLLAVFVFVIGGFKLAMSARAEYSALLGIPRTLVYAVSPVSGIFIVVAQIINIYEDLTGVKVE